MRKLISRVAMVLAFAFMGLGGGAADVYVSGLDVSGINNSTEARYPRDPRGCDRYLTGICPEYDSDGRTI